jgi:hypothetical protein
VRRSPDLARQHTWASGRQHTLEKVSLEYKPRSGEDSFTAQKNNSVQSLHWPQNVAKHLPLLRYKKIVYKKHADANRYTHFVYIEVSTCTQTSECLAYIEFHCALHGGPFKCEEKPWPGEEAHMGFRETAHFGERLPWINPEAWWGPLQCLKEQILLKYLIQ